MHLLASRFLHPTDAVELTRKVAASCGLPYPATYSLTTPHIKVIRRRHADRELVNLQDIVTSLREMNFTAKAYSFEKTKACEQVRLMLDSDVVVGPHGAGLTNVIWMKPCSVVIETFPWGYVLPQYFGNLAADSGKLYFPMCSVESCSDSRLARKRKSTRCFEVLNTSSANGKCHEIMNDEYLHGNRLFFKGANYHLHHESVITAVQQALVARESCLKRIGATTA